MTEEKDAVSSEREELAMKLDGMKRDRNNKLRAAKEQLVETLGITAEKYRTVTGTVEGMNALRYVYGESFTNIVMANTLAKKLAAVCESMVKKADSIKFDDAEGYGDFCEGFYEKDFKADAGKAEDNAWNMAYQLMCMDLCRSVGGSVADIASFIDRSSEEMSAVEERLADLEHADAEE